MNNLIDERKLIVNDLLRLSIKMKDLNLLNSHNRINDLLLICTYEIDCKLEKFSK